MNKLNKKLLKESIKDFSSVDIGYIKVLLKSRRIKAYQEIWYDSEPEYDKEEYLMHLEYLARTKMDAEGFHHIEGLKKYCEEKTVEELKAAHEHIEAQRKSYEQQRLLDNTWVDIYEDNEEAKKVLKKILKNYKSSQRYYIDKEGTTIYFYGRDTKNERDYMFLFEGE